MANIKRSSSLSRPGFVVTTQYARCFARSIRHHKASPYRDGVAQMKLKQTVPIMAEANTTTQDQRAGQADGGPMLAEVRGY